MTNVEETLSSPFDFAGGEVLLVDKPLEWTSFDVVGKLRNSMKPQKIKVGHAGTLDPLATGLLIICTGKFTKRIDSFQAEDKEYTGVITLGTTTPSYDLETAVNQTFDYTHITEADIYETALRFAGELEQYPPAHSAIKIKGERVYEKARRGEDVELKARRIIINSFDIEKIEMPNLYFRISCSKGTYIRSIAHDFGKALGIGAHLSKLRRTKSGDFHVDDAWNLQDLIEKIKLHRTTIQQQQKNS
ncbi:tRNA pseudouridine(55) synthase TruB [Sphingobacterium corticibacterium]|uniref:tRNA pseudouridine synthase B n=1 Tax=Sphingobacterium corticibacterium TaxID=2484746 RepID=A0A4Q6XNQ0_9SPHI|nr:tRNA pseudouridine(55) synthase TruB [Sphingobacterium corticibacterium]RZF61793.1 tRNA pseudouridine(55) synthase TruB [Sphingobacterium corticibacterium]